MGGYLQQIRSRVGSQKVLLVFGCALIRDEQGRILWQRRGDFGWWGLTGGMLELDESLPQCAVREAREETGLQVQPVRLVGLYTSPDFDVVYPNGDQVQQITACFECRPTGGTLQIDRDETLELNWHAPDDLPDTAIWYQAMIADLLRESNDCFYQQGGPGLRASTQPYYRWLRQYIGPQPYIGPAAVAFIQNEAGHVLLQRRGDTGEWGVPGGGMELGERIDQTLIHEVEEETGLRVQPRRLIGLYSDADFWVTYHGREQLKGVSALFACQVTGGSLHPDGDETLELRYFAPDNLPPLAPRYLRLVQDGLANAPGAVFK